MRFSSKKTTTILRPTSTLHLHSKKKRERGEKEEKERGREKEREREVEGKGRSEGWLWGKGRFVRETSFRVHIQRRFGEKDKKNNTNLCVVVLSL